MDELESMKYVLMTDDGGDVYTNAVVSYMKKILVMKQSKIFTVSIAH